MSSKIDTRIVEMEFKNQQFMAGVDQTLQKLSSLSDGLNIDSISDNVEKVSSKFSALGAIGFTGLQRLTNFAIDKGAQIGSALVDPIVEGGKKRALNIEQAKFQFKGLGMDVEQSMADANFAVQGTAFGLDEAAVAASQFGASGIKSGDEMRSALLGISGVAAMAGTSYSDMANVFTKVAGQGRVMGDDFNRLSARGISAPATIAKYLNKMGLAANATEADVRAMATKGQIDFKTFAAAMTDAFGEHATSASDTYTGAMSNMRAAFARIGALIYGGNDTVGGRFERLRLLFVAITPVINQIKAALEPLITAFNIIKMDNMLNNVKLIEKINLDDVVLAGKLFALTLTNINRIAQSFMQPIIRAFKEVFPPAEKASTALSTFAKWTAVVSAGLVLTGDKQLVVQKIFHTLFTTIKAGLGILKAAGTIFLIIGKTLMALGSIISSILSPITSFFGALISGTDQSDNRLLSFIDTINEFLSNLSGNWGDVLGRATAAVESFMSTKVVPFFEDLGTSAADARNKLNEFLNVTLDEWAAEASAKFQEAKTAVSEFIDLEVAPRLASWGDAISGAWESVGGFAGIWDRLKTAVTAVKDVIVTVWNNIGPIFQQIVAKVTEIKDNMKTMAGGLDFQQLFMSAVAGGSVLAFIEMFRALSGFAKKFRADTDDIKSGLTALGEGIRDGLLGETKASQIIKFAVAIGILAAAIYFLGQMDLKDLGAGLGGLSGAIAALVGGLYGVSKVMGPLQAMNMQKLAMSLLLFAASLWILSKAIVNMASLSMEQLVVGLTGLAVALAGLIIFTKVITAKEVTVMMSLGVALIAFAAAVWILSEALIRISTIPADKMGDSIQSLAVMMLGLTVAVKVLNGANPLKASVGLIAMAVALGMLVGVLYLMSLMDQERFADDLGNLLILLASLTASIAIIGAMSKDLHKGAAALMAMAISLGILVGVITLLGLIPWDILIQGLIVMGIIMAALVISLLALSAGSSSLVSGATALIAMAVAIGIIAVAVLILSSIELDAMIVALTGLVVIMMLLVVAAYAMTGTIAGAGAMILLAIAIGILAVSLVVLSAVPFEALMAGLIAIALGLAILLVAAAIAIAIAPGLLILAAAILVIGVGMMIAAVGVMVMAVAMIMLVGAAAGAAAAMLILGMAAGQLAPKMLALIAAGVGLIVLGAGMVVAGAGAILLGAGLMAMGAGMAMLVVVGVSGAEVIKQMVLELASLWTQALKLGAVTAELLLLGAALLAFGIGALAAAIGTVALAAGLGLLFLATIPGVPALQRLVEALEEAAPTVATAGALGTALHALGLGATRAAAGFLQANTQLKNLNTSLATLAMQVALSAAMSQVGFLLMSTSVLSFQLALTVAVTIIVANMQRLSSTVSGTAVQIQSSFVKMGAASGTSMAILSSTILVSSVLISAALNTLARGVQTNSTSVQQAILLMVTLVMASMTVFVTGTAQTSVAVTQAFARMTTAVLQSMSALASGVSSGVRNTINNAVSAAYSGGGQLYSAGTYVGSQLTRGMIAGLSSGQFAVAAKAAAVANAAYVAAKNALAVQSPSKKFAYLADMSVLAMVQQFHSGEDDVAGASADMGNTAIGAMEEALLSLNALLDEGLSSIDPTIRPVLDLSEIHEQIGELDELFGDGPGLSTTARLAYAAAARHDNTRTASGEIVGEAQPSSSVTFIQNNTSPKSLSNADIYRRTKNQLALAEKKLGV